MDLMAMDIKDRFCWMRKRHAFLNNIVEPYTSLDVFTNDKEEWFALLGVDLTKEEKWCYIYMWLDYGEYEIYFVIPGEDGHLTVSEVILWQDDTCANTYLNIFTLQGADTDEIMTSIHNYS